jgi:hypothetical protein
MRALIACRTGMPPLWHSSVEFQGFFVFSAREGGVMLVIGWGFAGLTGIPPAAQDWFCSGDIFLLEVCYFR